MAQKQPDCKHCPDHATSPEGSSEISACTCGADGFYQLLNASHSSTELCRRCPIGADCSRNRTDVTLRGLPLEPGHWRWRRDVDAVLLCPDSEQDGTGCVGGVDDYCKEGLTGPYCMLCPEERRETHYYDTASSTCIDCASTSTPLIIYTLPLILVAAIAVVLFRRQTASRPKSRITVHILQGLRRISASYALFRIEEKARQFISFLQIMTNVPGAYGIRYPQSFRRLLSPADGTINVQVSGLITRVDHLTTRVHHLATSPNHRRTALPHHCLIT